MDWLADVVQPPRALSDPVGLPALLGNDRRPIADREQWRRRRSDLLAWWSEFLGFMPRSSTAPRFKVLKEDRVEGVVRQLIAYETAPGWPTEAYLLKPSRRRGPAVVVFHSTVDHSIRQPAGMEGVPEKAFGLTLARQGFLALCPRNFLWPTNDRIEARAQAARFLRESPGAKGMAKMLADAMVAVDLVASLPQVDPQRIGALGHSLGAKQVLYLAAFDERVQVHVSSEGGIGMSFSNWHDPWYLGAEIRDPAFHHDHHELLAMAGPRPFLLVAGESADGDRSWPYIEAAMPVYRLLTNRPRLGLLNHRQGHAVPPLAARRISEWFKAYL